MINNSDLSKLAATTGKRTSRFIFCAMVASVMTTSLAVAGDAPPVLSWEELTPATNLPARSFFASAYDAVSGKIVVFGGLDSTGQQLDETWTFDGNSWSQVETTVSPGPRAAAGMAYDRQTQKLILFGGFVGSTLLDDTWTWDGATSSWTQATPHHIPTGATNPMLFTDPRNGHADMFGGYQGLFYSRSMWRWLGTDWHLLTPVTTPYPRSGAVTVLDPARKRVVLFGGISDNWIVQNTWTWDGIDWTLENPKTQPPPLYFTSGGYDVSLGKIIVFGGGSQGIDQNTTWAWNGNNWAKVFTSNTPGAREGFATIWYPPLHQFLIFDGDVFNSDRFFSDLWSLSAE